MNIPPTTINIYDYILTLPKVDIAGVLTACGYALRESMTLADALEELGFAGIDLALIEDIECDRQLALIAQYCVCQISIQVHTND